MWVTKILLDTILTDGKKTLEAMIKHQIDAQRAIAQLGELKSQKSKDDITIDWMRHRINSLEKVNSQLLMKAAGIMLPVPEIVPSRPGTMTVPSFDYMPSFDDPGDDMAREQGIVHSSDGSVEYMK